jgi:cytochrome c553
MTGGRGAKRRRHPAPAHAWKVAKGLAVAPLLAGFGAFLFGAQTATASSIAAKVPFCASCHGRDGLPSDHTVPIIWGQQAAYLQKQLIDYRNGDRDSQIMSSIAESLSDDDVSQIAAHFGGLAWPVQSRRSPLAVPNMVAACRACHGANLAGGPSAAGVAPRLAGQFSPYLIDAMTAYANGERANSAPMSALMQSLSTAARKAIADYLGAMR